MIYKGLRQTHGVIPVIEHCKVKCSRAATQIPSHNIRELIMNLTDTDMEHEQPRLSRKLVYPSEVTRCADPGFYYAEKTETATVTHTSNKRKTRKAKETYPVSELVVYCETDGIYNSMQYTWKRKGYDLFTEIVTDNFEFLLEYRPREDVLYIKVYYTKGVNRIKEKGRRKKIDTIEIAQPVNEDIAEAIKEWRSKFSMELMRMKL